jgi:hypothetical protein
MQCGLAAGIDAVRRVGVQARRVLLFGVGVDVPETTEYVALGARSRRRGRPSASTTLLKMLQGPSTVP